MEPDALPGPGDVLEGKVELRQRLGEGGMGTVFEAYHRRTGRVVAVKMLRPDIARSATAASRFLQEALACGRVRHPNVVDILDASTAEGHPYMVMELLEGETLSAHLARRGPLPIADALDLLTQALTGLAAAHEAGVIHRDLKPDNLFLSRSPTGATVVKILDFGISKVAVADPLDETAMALTHPGVVMGTPFFMSPEQARGRTDLDVRADIYAAGAILYMLLTGRPPFLAENYNSLIAQILMDEPPPIAELRAEVPASLARVVARAMAKERDERFGSATELADRLRRQTRVIPQATVMMTDLDGFSAFAREAPLEDVEVVLEHWEHVHEDVVGRHGGVVRDQIADEMICTFRSPLDAVRAWLELVDPATHPEALRPQIRFRAGLAVGDLRIVRSAMYGGALNLGARLTASGAPGVLVLPEEIAAQLPAELAARLRGVDPGESDEPPDPERRRIAEAASRARWFAPSA